MGGTVTGTLTTGRKRRAAALLGPDGAAQWVREQCRLGDDSEAVLFTTRPGRTWRRSFNRGKNNLCDGLHMKKVKYKFQ